MPETNESGLDQEKRLLLAHQIINQLFIIKNQYGNEVRTTIQGTSTLNNERQSAELEIFDYPPRGELSFTIQLGTEDMGAFYCFDMHQHTYETSGPNKGKISKTVQFQNNPHVDKSGGPHFELIRLEDGTGIKQEIMRTGYFLISSN